MTQYFDANSLVQSGTALEVHDLNKGKCRSRLSIEESQKMLSRFIQSAKRKHGSKFSYKETKAEEMNDGIVTISCTEHGLFQTHKYSHIKASTGMCRGCIGESKRISRQERYIKHATQKYKGRFTYTDVKYIDKNIKITIKCEKHGDFNVLPLLHLKRENGGCFGCKREKIALQQSKMYVAKFKKIHGIKQYDYSEVNCSKLTDKIKVICRDHGAFSLTVVGHLRGAKCPTCEKIEKYTPIFKEKYGDAFDYSEIKVFKNVLTKIPIRCVKHDNRFTQTTASHLLANGCKCCIRDAENAVYQDSAVAKLKAHLGDGYDVSESVYRGHRSLISVRCKTHGVFERTYSAMFRVKTACIKCDASGIVSEKTKHLVAKFKEVHGDKYDFSSVVAVKRSSKVIVGCHKHGQFEITPDRLIEGKGCFKCYEENRPDMTKEEWLTKFREKHGNKYLYKLLPDRVLKNKSITVICPKHSNFVTRPETHLVSGCPRCKRVEEKTLNFWKTIKENFGNNLIYKRFDIIEDYAQEVVLTCAEHGDFSRSARNHMRSKEGCPSCRTGMSTEILKQHLIDKFGDRMIVTTVSFTGWRKPIRMHCRKHGAISTTAIQAMREGFDCKWCKEAK